MLTDDEKEMADFLAGAPYRAAALAELTDDEKEMADFLAGAPYRATALADMARELAGKVAGTYADVHLMADALRHHAAALTAAAERERVLREALHTAGRCIKELDGYGKPRPTSPSVETVLSALRAALETQP